jgi:hypothetical protein
MDINEYKARLEEMDPQEIRYIIKDAKKAVGRKSKRQEYLIERLPELYNHLMLEIELCVEELKKRKLNICRPGQGR